MASDWSVSMPVGFKSSVSQVAIGYLQGLQNEPRLQSWRPPIGSTSSLLLLAALVIGKRRSGCACIDALRAGGYFELSSLTKLSHHVSSFIGASILFNLKFVLSLPVLSTELVGPDIKVKVRIRVRKEEK